MLEDALATALTEVFDDLVGRRGWSLSRLAAVADVSRQTIRNWQLGVIEDPRYLGLARLFHLAGHSLDLLAGPKAVPAPLSLELIQAAVAEELDRQSRPGVQVAIIEERGPGWRKDPAAIQRIKDAIAELLDEREAQRKQSRNRAG